VNSEYIVRTTKIVTFATIRGLILTILYR